MSPQSQKFGTARVSILAQPVLALARPCHLPGSPFAAFAWILSYSILVFTERPAVSCGIF